LSSIQAQLRAAVFVELLNQTPAAVSGQWGLVEAPENWRLAASSASAASGALGKTRLSLELGSLSYNQDGIARFVTRFEQADGAAPLQAPARLAVASAVLVEQGPRIDGDLSDWSLASNNALSDFRLCRGPGASAADGQADLPSQPTQAFVCMDSQSLYVAVRCRIANEQDVNWRADNAVPVDGAIPWGQDVVEILLDPHSEASASPDDVYCLQIKPNGAVLSRRGCVTQPPVSRVSEWVSGARVAVAMLRNEWRVELALPLSSLPASALRERVWGLNVARLDSRRGEYSSWSGAKGWCYGPETFGNLVLGTP
jgi:hypothetical protein